MKSRLTKLMLPSIITLAQLWPGDGKTARYG